MVTDIPGDDPALQGKLYRGDRPSIEGTGQQLLHFRPLTPSTTSQQSELIRQADSRP
jgi:hypothetical protein